MLKIKDSWIKNGKKIMSNISHWYGDKIEEAHRKYPNVPKEMIVALIRMESSGNPSAISPKGAIGLMQLMPGTAKDLGVNPFDISQNIEGGTHYMSKLLNRYNGNIDMALAAYNEGMSRVDKNGLNKMPNETKDYINKYHGTTQ